MKKSIITITIIALMFFALSGIAYSQVFKDVEFVNVYPNWEPDAGGDALINYNPPNDFDSDSKKTGVVIQASLWGLNPNNEYSLTSCDGQFEKVFKPNNSGNASVHISFRHDFFAKMLFVNRIKVGDNSVTPTNILKAIPPLPDPEN